MEKRKSPGLFNKILQHFSKEKKKEEIKFKIYLELVKENPICASHRLKLAEIYYKRGEKKKAVSESLIAAKNFCNAGYYRKGLAIYKRLLKEQPWLEHVKLKIANINREIGFLDEASSQYLELYNNYNSMGLKNKAAEIARFMNDLDPQKSSKIVAKNLRTNGSENGLKSQRPNENMSQNILDLPVGNEKESFFDIAAAIWVRNLRMDGSENGLKSRRPNENISQTILDLPMGNEKESFFDLAAALESDDF